MAIEGEASTIIEAPIERVYEVAADVEGSIAWQPQFKSVTCLERDADGEQVLVDNETDATVRTLKSRLRFSYDKPNGLSWKQEKGDLSDVEGGWRFEDLGEGRTKATYSLRVDLGRMLGMVIRGPLVGLMKGQLIDTMPDKLKGYVEANPSG
jgi:hypothetical protein